MVGRLLAARPVAPPPRGEHRDARPGPPARRWSRARRSAPAPSGPGLDLEIAVADSTVLDTARDTNLINLGLLVLVTGVLLVRSADVDRQTLATVLTLFPAVQAGPIGRPDRSTVRGLLSQPTYLLSLATAMPPLLLAAALATLHEVRGLAGPGRRVHAPAARPAGADGPAAQ